MGTIGVVVLIMSLVTVSAVINRRHNPNDTSLIAKTTNGLIKGKLMKTFNKNIEYIAFFKIPFAKPPVGRRRFAAPEASDRWDEVYDATKEGEQCTQYGENNTVVGSEDCLFLRVYVPKQRSEKEDLRPIIYFIHGGGLTAGSPNFETYGPDLFMEKDVILALVQYRLGFYGFCSTEDLICPGNNGLKDQRLGLKWIKENAEMFGGDPNKITIVGHSAGAVSTGYLVDTPTTAGLFRAAIQQSADEIACMAKQYQARKKAFLVGKRLGIPAINSVDLIERLRKIDYKKLYEVSDSVGADVTKKDGSLAYSPIVEPEHPDAILTEKPLQILKNGTYNRVPMIIGFTSLEALTLMGLVRTIKAEMKSDITILVPNTIVPKDNTTKIFVANQIKKYYIERNDVDYGLLRYVGDNMIVRPILQKSRIISTRSPTYLYKFSYIGVLGEPTNPQRRGVGHGEELWYMFRQTNEPKDVPERDTRIRNQLVTMWTDFVKTLHPISTKQSLLDNVTWPRLSEDTDYLSLSIDKTLSIQKRVNEGDLKFWEKMFTYDTGHVGWY